MPDPEYKNIYWYPDIGTNPLDPFTGNNNQRPKAFFDSNTADVQKYSFTPESPIYCVGNNERAFVLDVPDNGSFPTAPVYMAIRTSPTTETAVYRYAFITSRAVLSDGKIRYSCMFDQWSEHFADLAPLEYSFIRRHQRRYVGSVDSTPLTKKYNGLNDPDPEGMVQGRKITLPVPGLFNSSFMVGTSRHYLIPVWIYWRLSTSVIYNKNENDAWVKRNNPLLGVDQTKSAVPIICFPLGIFEFESGSPTTYTFREISKLQRSDGTDISTVYSNNQTKILGFSHPYIVQGIISTIPPFDHTLVSDSGKYIVKIADTDYNGVEVATSSIRIGTDDTGALVAPSGTILGISPGYGVNYGRFLSGSSKNVTITDNSESAFDDSYEPKIEESAFEGTTFNAFGADLDVSPTPANPNTKLYFRVGAHWDFIFTSGNSTTELHRFSGITPSFGLDSAIETIAQWLVTSAQTHNNAEIWKGWNNLISTGRESIAGSRAGVGTALAPLASGMMGFVHDVQTEAARQKDMRNSPNSVNVVSSSGVDNFPFVDIPRIKRRVIPDEIKTKIMRYWHVYGYPDNSSGTITDSMIRTSFVYVQGAPRCPLRGLLPGEQDAIFSAIRSGTWIYRIKCRIAHGTDFANYYSEINENKATVDNREVNPT